MVQPIRAVGLFLPATAACPLSARAWGHTAAARCTWTWVNMPLWQWLDQITRCALLTAPLKSARAASCPPAAEPSEAWRPWPSHSAFIDEIRRWWPSDELPPIDSSTAATAPDLARIILVGDWRRGTVIDLFV